MAQDWAADVKRYAPDADDDVIAGIVRHCGIALQNRDSALVSFKDPVETARVRDNFLKKKLGRTESDSDLDTAIAGVGDQMKGDRTKNRVTAYYLLADRYGAHDVFRKGKAAGSTAAADGDISAGSGAAGLAALGAAGVAAGAAGHSEPALLAAEPDEVAEPPAGRDRGRERAAAPPQRIISEPANDTVEERGGMGWLWWIIGLAVLAFLLWWLFLRHPAEDATPAVAPTAETASDTAMVPAAGAPAAAAGADLASAPAEGSVAVPAGAGVTVETRGGKPVAKVYFDTAKAAVVPAFADTAAGLKNWLDTHPGSKLAISGYNDPSGNAAANAALSKDRAQAVQAALVNAGIPAASTALVKPADTTDATTDKASARRVEVVVQ